MKILVTAFDPFGDEPVNPALEAVKLINEDHIRAELVKLEVPTIFHESIDLVAEKIREEKPDVVVAVGQAGGRFDITPERVAINEDDARIEDNAGNQPIDVPIKEDGEPAYFTTLPIKAMVEAIREAGLPASVSNSAGTFVCNHLMYGILYTLAQELPEARGGFIHVPFIPEQVVDKRNMPSMALEDMVKGLEAALNAIVDNSKDIKAVGGTIA